MDYQHKYFLEGDETLLRPMILKDIAERVNLDISTISRVANSKYVQTPFGTFLLKSFFSESIQNDQGEEVSTREIKKILSDCRVAEDKSKPLTDGRTYRYPQTKGLPNSQANRSKIPRTTQYCCCAPPQSHVISDCEQPYPVSVFTGNSEI